jgi:hypothetical protein
MKKLIFNLILILIILTISTCKQDNVSVPLKFKGYEGNPVLTPGEPGSWDDLYVISAFVMEERDTIYLFYTAYSLRGTRALGVATSTDGFHFEKYQGNPILTGDKTGFDAFGVAQAQVLKEDSLWVLYFNAREIAGFSSGPFIGRAIARSLKGPWIKDEYPVLTSGKMGEWDSEFIYLGPVLKKSNGSYVMYFGGGVNIVSQKNFFIGMATSTDGILWRKFNDPKSVGHPFSGSDPVLMNGKTGAWDADIVLPCAILKTDIGYGMIYSCDAFGYAESKDGIRWIRSNDNPFYILDDDPYYHEMNDERATMQGAKLLFTDSVCYMYYDYGHCEKSAISMATAPVKQMGVTP